MISGYCTDQWMARPKNERRDACIKQLVHCLGKAAADYVEYIEFNWMEESAAHMHHMVSEHIAPAAKASMQVKYYE